MLTMNLTLSTVFASIFSLGSIHADTTAQPIIYAGRTIDVIVPEQPLAAGSLTLAPNSNLEQLYDWQDDQKLETYDLIQRIVSVWEKKGVHDYFIFGKQTPNTPFRWEIIPFPKEGFRFWKQFSLLWNMTFGSPRLSDEDRTAKAQNFQKENDLLSASYIAPASTECIGNDPFCKRDVIDRQLVYEGKEINLLYNYAPIVLGEGKLHFLILPKQHRKGFSDLTETEYLEAMQLVQRLVDHYKDKGYPIAYIFDKTGTEAGQTVPHWHEHVVFAASENEAFLAKLTVLKNMIFYSSPLPQDELKTKVESLRKELAGVL